MRYVLSSIKVEKLLSQEQKTKLIPNKKEQENSMLVWILDFGRELQKYL